MAKRKKRNRGGGTPFNPDIDTGTRRPVTARVAVGDINDKFSDYPSNGLTPRRLARIFREADEGNVRAQMELFEEMEEKDTHLFSQMQTRKLAVTGLDWEVQPFSEDEINKEIADFVDEQLKGIENFDEVLIDMLDAIGKGISIMELAWTVEDGRNVIEDIEYVHPKKLVWDSTTDELKICTKEYPSGVELPENKFVVHKYKAKSGHASRAGIMRVVSWMYLFKNYDIKDWVSFCEVFGMPLRLGKYDASASEDDKKQLMEAIISLGTDAAGIVPSSTMIEFIESQKTTSVEIYEKLARYCDEQISKAKNTQEIRSLRHDMQSHVNAMSYFSKEKDWDKLQTYIEEVNENAQKVRPYTVNVNHGFINAILEDSLSKEPEIAFSCDGKIPADIQIDDYDLCTIFSNLIRNAIEACNRLPEDAKKWIHLDLYMLQDNLYIRMENPVMSEVNVQKLEGSTSKEDKKNHGFGIYNLKNAVEKYQGEVSFDCEDQKFIAEIVLWNV